MRLKRVCFLMFVFVFVVAVFAFGFYRLPSISKAVEARGNYKESYKIDTTIVKEKGSVFLSGGEKVLQQDQPVAEGELDCVLGNLFGPSDPLANAGNMSDTLMGSCLAYTSGVPRENKSGDFNGYDVYLTLDAKMQTAVYDILSNTRGQALLVNYETGEILAMVSQGKDISLRDCFDMGNYDLDENGKVKYTERTANSTVETRIYPGSTIKPILAAGIIEAGYEEALRTFRYICDSKREQMTKDWALECYKGTAHGNIGLTEALTDSCNKFLPYFVNENGVDRDSLIKQLKIFGLEGNNELSKVHTQKATLCLEGENSYQYMFIGQGDTKLPLLSLIIPYMAMANQGVVSEPHYIAAYSEIGETERKIELEVQKKSIMKAETADLITSSLKKTVASGTASAIGSEIDVYFKLAVKTGTADYETEGTHKLCISYSGNDNYPYLLAVDIPQEEGAAIDKTREIWTMIR